jgi:hypothetical protein
MFVLLGEREREREMAAAAVAAAAPMQVEEDKKAPLDRDDDFVYFRIYDKKPSSGQHDPKIWHLLPDNVVGQERLRVIGGEIFGSATPIDQIYISLARRPFSQHHDSRRIFQLSDAGDRRDIRYIDLKVKVPLATWDMMVSLLRGVDQSLAVWNQVRATAGAKAKDWLEAKVPTNDADPIAWLYSLVTIFHNYNHPLWQRIHPPPLADGKTARSDEAAKDVWRKIIAPVTAPRLKGVRPDVEFFLSPSKIEKEPRWHDTNTFWGFQPITAESLPRRGWWIKAMRYLDDFIKKKEDRDALKNVVFCYIVTI